MLGVHAAAMAHVRIVRENEGSDALREAYARVRAARGDVANLHEALSLRPEAIQAFLAYDTAVLHGPDAPGRLSRRERELVGLVVSHETGDNYGLTHHADAFSRYVTEPGLVALVAAGAFAQLREPHLSQREAALAEYAQRLASSPRAILPDDVGALRRAGLSDEEIVDAALVAAFVAMVNRLALGLGVSREDATKPFRY